MQKPIFLQNVYSLRNVSVKTTDFLFHNKERVPGYTQTLSERSYIYNQPMTLSLETLQFLGSVNAFKGVDNVE
jgi:hypothetical protein